MSVDYKSIIVIGYTSDMLDFSNCEDEDFEGFDLEFGTYVDGYVNQTDVVYGQMMWKTDYMIKMPLWAVPQIDTNKFYLDLAREFAQYNVKIKRECAMPNLFLICQCG